jgi:hypothetical protein
MLTPALTWHPRGVRHPFFATCNSPNIGDKKVSISDGAPSHNASNMRCLLRWSAGMFISLAMTGHKDLLLLWPLKASPPSVHNERTMCRDPGHADSRSSRATFAAGDCQKLDMVSSALRNCEERETPLSTLAAIRSSNEKYQQLMPELNCSWQIRHDVSLKSASISEREHPRRQSLRLT